MSLTQLDTRVALMAQAPQIDFHRLAGNTLELYDNMKQRGQQGLLSRLIAQNTGADGQVNLNSALLSAQSNPGQAYQANTVNTLSGMIQQQNALKAKALQDAEKHKADTFKTTAEAGKLQFEGLGKELENTQKGQTALANLIATSISPSDALAKVGSFGQQYGLTPDVINHAKTMLSGYVNDSENGTANFENMKKSFGLFGTPEPIKYMSPDANTVLTNQTSEANNKRTVAATVYGTDKSFELGKDKLKQDQKQFQQKFEYEAQQEEFKKGLGEFKEFGGKTYFVYKDGRFKAAVDESGQHLGASGNKGLTEQQSKDALFGARMQESNEILNDLEGKGISQTVMSRMPWLGDTLSTALPSALGGANENQGKYMQAQRDFINAVLRKESGAAIADSEFSNAQKQYFPQVGDSKEIIAQKARNRELATKMILIGAGQQGQQSVGQVTGKGIPYAAAGLVPQIDTSSFMP